MTPLAQRKSPHFQCSLWGVLQWTLAAFITASTPYSDFPGSLVRPSSTLPFSNEEWRDACLSLNGCFAYSSALSHAIHVRQLRRHGQVDPCIRAATAAAPATAISPATASRGAVVFLAKPAQAAETAATAGQASSNWLCLQSLSGQEESLRWRAAVVRAVQGAAAGVCVQPSTHQDFGDTRVSWA